MAKAPRYTHRIRRCEGNKKAWLLCRIRDDGSEMNSYGGFTTAYSLDALLQHAGHLAPRPDDRVDFVHSAEG